MSGLDELKQRIETKLAAAEERNKQQYRQVSGNAMELVQRQRRFDEVTPRLMTDLIQPRLEQLACHFDNVEPAAGPGWSSLRRAYQFRHTPRFPVTATLELAISRDGPMQNIVVTCDLELLPVLTRFAPHQEISLPLMEVVNEVRLGKWVDDRLCEFVDTYLRIEQPDAAGAENLATDPVCGMAIKRAYAAGKAEHNGQTYYFCGDECRQQFLKEPARYLTVASSIVA